MPRRTIQREHATSSRVEVGAPAPRRLAGVAACFFLSGFAALIYQTAWLRQFSLDFGTSEFAVSAVLAAYMGGLALGAGLAAKLVRTVSRPILVYALLEAGIALSAMAVPALLAGARMLYTWMLGDLAEPPGSAAIGQPIFYLTVTFVVLAIPTGLMGATLPLLTRYAVRSDEQVGPSVALLYAMNTAGAVAGVVVAAFTLLPMLGLRGTVWVGVVVNGLVFFVAASLARGTGERPVPEVRSADAQPQSAGFITRCIAPAITGAGSVRLRVKALFLQQPGWMLPLMLVSGATAFFYEVLWTRMLSHVLGGSIYAFATMLAAFLSGIAIGGGLSAGITQNRQRAAIAFAVAQVAIALSSMAVYAWIEALIPETRGTAQSSVYAAFVMLPGALFIGATFPFAVRIVAENEREAGPVSALVYAWNTVGAIVGALLAGLLLIPSLGFEGSIKLAVTVNSAIALSTVVCVLPFNVLSAAAAGLILALASIFYTPVRPRALISSTGFFVPTSADSKELYFAVGRSSTVLLLDSNGTMELRTNGLPEASVVARGGAPLEQAQHWLLGLPVAARSGAESMMLIGLGGGVALEGVPRSVRAIDVIEIEPEVVNANRRMADRRLVDPLEDPRVTVIVNDARNALSLTNKRYDAIVSQPSHPWTAGASHLFTRDFLKLSKAHLNADGVFVQWMSAAFIDGPLLRSFAATMLDTFEYVRLYQTGAAQLFFIGSDERLDVELELARTGHPLTENLLHYSYMGLGSIEDFVASLALDEDGLRRLAAGATVITDDKNQMATHSRGLADGLSQSELATLLSPYDPLIDRGSWVYRQLGAGLNFAYVVRRWLRDGNIERARRLRETVQDASLQLLISAQLSGYAGQVDAVSASLRAALRADPSSAEARFALLESELPAFARGEASQEAKDLVIGLPRSGSAVIAGWRYAATEDWRALADLDSVLADAKITDLWFPEATQLRAQWRTRAADATYARDALRMLDRALLIRPTLSLYVLRAAAADRMSDIDAFAETVSYAAEYVDDLLNRSARGAYTLSKTELDVARRQLQGLRSRLLQTADMRENRPQAVARRVEQVVQRVDVFDVTPR
jgi:spermidine synthase